MMRIDGRLPVLLLLIALLILLTPRLALALESVTQKNGHFISLVKFMFADEPKFSITAWDDVCVTRCLPECYDRLRLRAYVFMATNRAGEAEVMARCLISLREDPIWLWQLGKILWSAGKADEVQQLWLGKAPAARAEAECVRLSGIALSGEDWLQAGVICDLATRVRPDSWLGWYWVGRAALQQPGEAERALLAFRKAYHLAVHPTISLQTYLGWSLYGNGQYSEAIALIKKTLVDDPVNQSALAVMGLSLKALGRLSEAEPYLRKLAEIAQVNSPSPGYAYYIYGRLLLDLGEYAAAEEQCKQALNSQLLSSNLLDPARTCLEAARNAQKDGSLKR